MRCRNWLSIIILSTILWFSTPTDTGYYWMKHNTSPIVLVYVCQVRKAVIIFDVNTKMYGQIELNRIPTTFKFQGPLEPCINGVKGDKL